MPTQVQQESAATHAHAGLRTSASALLGATVLDRAGKSLGRVRELGVLPQESPFVVSALLLSGGGLCPVSALRYPGEGTLELAGEIAPAGGEGTEEQYLLLERDVLDQQIIDVHGHKVVRVNDVNLLWERRDAGAGTVLRIQEVEVGPRGAIWRLLKGLPAGVIRPVAERFPANVIPWDFVDLIDRDPARRVRLKIEQDRLLKMHPSDLADILEELAPPERQALFRSLDEEVAAETLEEIEPRLQQALLAAIDSERVADIVEEMDPGAAADLLSGMPEADSERILQGMEPEERQEVEDLLEFKGDSAAGRMTTEYIALGPQATASEAREALATFEGDPEAITDIYLLDETGRLAGMVSLVQLLLADPHRSLGQLPQGHLLSCPVDAPARKVAETFDKYNLRSLPVVDEDEVMVGVVHAEQVIALLRERR